MNTVGLDLSATWVGWSFFEATELKDIGTWHIAKGVKGEGYGARWVRLTSHLFALSAKFHIDRVAYEDITFLYKEAGFRAPQRWGGALSITQVWFETLQLRTPLAPIHVADVKQLAVGKGAGPGTQKEFILIAAQKRWPLAAIRDHHAADAGFVADAAIQGMHIKRARDVANRKVGQKRTASKKRREMVQRAHEEAKQSDLF